MIYEDLGVIVCYILFFIMTKASNLDIDLRASNFDIDLRSSSIFTMAGGE